MIITPYGINGLGEVPSTTATDAEKRVYQAYRTYLGRDPEDGAIKGQLSQNRPLEDIITAISTSEEAQKRASVMLANNQMPGVSGNTASKAVVDDMAGNLMSMMPEKIFGMSPMMAGVVGIVGVLVVGKVFGGGRGRR